MNLVERDGLRRVTGCFPGSLLLATLVPSAAIAQAPSHPPTSLGLRTFFPRTVRGWAPSGPCLQGVQFTKNNGAGNNHAGARTTAAVPPPDRVTC
jgi:hypothetical protein